MGAYMSHFIDKHWFLYMFAMLWCAQVWFSLWLILLLIHSTSCIWSLMFVATFENSAIMPSNTCFCPIFFLFSFWNHNYIPTKGWRRSKGNSFRLNCLCAFHPISSVSLVHIPSDLPISGLKVLISRSTQNYLSKFVSVVKTQNTTVHSPSYPMEKLHFNSKSLYFKGVMTWLGADTLAFRYLTHGSEPRGRGGYIPCPLAQPPHLSPLKSSLI